MVHSGHQHYLWFVIIALLIIFAGAVILFQKDTGNLGALASISNLPSTGRVYTIYYNQGVFSPTVIQTHFGDTVKFSNQSEGIINVTADLRPEDDGLPLFRSDEIKKGEVWTTVIKKKGIVSYHNEKKPEEAGTVVVK